MSQTPISLVEDWHRKFGVHIHTAPNFDAPTCALRISLLLEEKEELFQAVNENNRVDILDALCDLQYVLSGAILHTGMQFLMGEDKRMQYVRNTAHIFEIPSRVMLLSIKIKYLGHQLGSENIGGAVSSFRDLQFILDGLIEATGFGNQFDRAFLAVHENNMAKLWSEDQVAHMLPAGHVGKPCDWKAGYYIVRNEAAKIIKPPTHKKVDLRRFV